MKLHLPKTLLAAVVACFAAGASYGVSVSSQASWSVSDLVTAIDTAAEGEAVTKTWNGTTYTFTKSDGMLAVSGYSLSGTSLSNVSFQADKTALQALSEGTNVSLVHIKFSNHTWGANVKGTAEGSSSVFTGQAGTNTDWSTAGRPNVSNMADDGIVSAYFDTSAAPGFSLANGTASQTTSAKCIYYADALRWSDSSDLQSVNFNTTYVTALIQTADSYQSGADSYTVTNADGTWTKTYTSATNGVSDTTVGATMVTGGRLTVTSADAGKVSTNGGDIIVGGSGQLFLQTWGSSADIVLANDIYLGGSTHGEANTYGILRFGTDGGHSVALNGNVTLIEDSTMGSNGNGSAVDINGKVSGDYTLTIVGGNEVNLNGGVDLGTLQMNNGTALDITAKAATIGIFRNSGSATVTVTGTSLTISKLYAGTTGALTTGEGGSIVFGEGASIDVANLTAVGSSDYTVDGFIQESYRVTASGVNASITGDSIALVNGSLSLGSGTWNDGVVSMGDAIYNVATTKSYSDYQAAATEAGKTAAYILVQADGTFQANRAGQTIAITGEGTLEATWSGRAQASAAISTAAKTFHGDVVVKSGASWLIGNDYSFSSVTVESGGQFGLDGTYTGDITISGAGAGTAEKNSDWQGALKFGNGGTLSGNLTIVGNKAALSTWGTDAGTITGDVTSTTEGGVELEILNGTSATTSNTITVNNNLSGINKVTTTGGSMTVNGTVTGFGATFTKDGAGTLTLSKVGAMTSGKVVVNGGTLALTGEGSGGTLSGVDVEVNAGATVQVGHDCAGWSGGTSSITLLGETGSVAKMVNTDTTTNGNTWNTNLNLKGYATVEEGNLTSFGGALNAEGTNNTFASKLLIAKSYTVTVADGGELEISGQIADSAHGQAESTAQLIKEGAGNLTLSNTNNTFTRGGIALNAGTLTIDNDADTTTAAAISGNGALATSGDGAKTFSGAVSVKDATLSGGKSSFASLTVGGTLTLSGTENLDVTGTLALDGSTLNLTGLNITATSDEQVITLANVGTLAGGSVTVTGLDLGDRKWSLQNANGTVVLASGGTVGEFSGVSAASLADSLQLIVAGYTAPVELTATSVLGYNAATATLDIAVGDLSGLTGKDFNVTVGEAVWQGIVTAMSGVDGGVYNNATITLNGEALTGFGTVSFNGYAGTGTQGEYFVAYIPEPTTGTLSVLALAALALRRRRK